MNYNINEYTTIENFKTNGVMENHSRFGEPHQYEQFTGLVNKDKVKGLVSVTTGNIYGLTTDES